MDVVTYKKKTKELIETGIFLSINMQKGNKNQGVNVPRSTMKESFF